MPLRDLVEYFNQRISAEQGLSQPPLVVNDGLVEGKFAGLRLATGFHPVRRADDGTTVVGHVAELKARGADGGNTLATALFDHTEAGRVVGLDRLCRTIH
ncbi:MAG: hypothetical protein FIA97_07645, partial [Methylococcaceae bacterium]|nr:hypothetical protein [Methylococcaceae bacterium]